MSQQTPPTYTPPAPVNAISGADAQTQGYSLAQQEYGPQMGAQAQGLADIAQGNSYYSNFGPTSLDQAIGNQYFSNIWPQEQAMIGNQFASSGMANSPALASTEANAYGNLGVNVGEFLSGQSNQNATNNLSQLMSINPSSFVNPITGEITQQSNINTQQQNAYQQALAQQQYQQAYNQYSQNNSLANTIGQISPIGGQIYGGATGTSGSAFAGTAGTLGSPLSALGMNQAMSQYNMQPGVQSYGGSGSAAGSSSSNGASSGYGGSSTSSGYGMPSGNQLFGSNPLSMAMMASGG